MGFWQTLLNAITQGALAGLLNGLLNHPKTTVAATAAIQSVKVTNEEKKQSE